MRENTTNLEGALVSWLLFLIAVFSSWATYNQFAIGLTYVTLPALLCILIVFLSFIFRLKVPRLFVADFAILVIYLIAFFSQIWTLGGDGWSLQIYWYTICYSVYFSTRFFVVTEKRIKLVVYGVVIGSIIGCLLVKEQVNEWGVILDRQTIEGLNANFTAYSLVGGGFLVHVVYKIGLLPLWFKYVTFLLNLFVFSKLLLLDTRGALISFVLMWAWFLGYKFLPKKIITPLIVSALIVTILIPLGFFNEIQGVFEVGTGRDTGDLSGRLPSWGYAMGYILENPFLGIGIGSFALVSPLGIGAHNVFLTFLLEVGGIGFCCFMAFLFGMFSQALKYNASMEQRFILGAFFCFWLPIAASGHWELSPFSWLLLGLTFNLVRLPRVQNGS